MATANWASGSLIKNHLSLENQFLAAGWFGRWIDICAVAIVFVDGEYYHSGKPILTLAIEWQEER